MLTAAEEWVVEVAGEADAARVEVVAAGLAADLLAAAFTRQASWPVLRLRLVAVQRPHLEVDSAVAILEEDAAAAGPVEGALAVAAA